MIYKKDKKIKINMSVDYIRAGKIDDYIYDNNTIIVDVRNEDEYNLKHIKNAINIPHDKLENMLTNMKNFNREKIYVVYCDRGSLSMSICRKMSMHGLRTITVVGGINQYRGNYLTR